MAYTVKNMKEINYIGMSECERKEIWRLGDLADEQMCTCFDEDGDYFALYKDMDVPDTDSNDDRTYAVYLHNSGRLLCLLSDAGPCLEGYKDMEYGCKRNELYRQIALAAGWPEKLPTPHMTWRELKSYINSLPEEAKEMEVLVWVAPKNGGTKRWLVSDDNFIPITSVSRFDAYAPISKDNELSINLDLWED